MNLAFVSRGIYIVRYKTGRYGQCSCCGSQRGSVVADRVRAGAQSQTINGGGGGVLTRMCPLSFEKAVPVMS